MVYKWKVLKGLEKRELHKCSRCGGLFVGDEFSFEDDSCLFCLFPEAQNRRAADKRFVNGSFVNVPVERELLDSLDRIPVHRRDKSFSKEERVLLKRLKTKGLNTKRLP